MATVRTHVIKVNLISEQIELTKLLVSNDPRTRSDGIKRTKQLLLNNSGDTSDDITPDKNSKSPKSPKSPTPEQRVLRRRTIIIFPEKRSGLQNKQSTPKRKLKNNSETNVLKKRRKTIAGEEMSELKPEEISNKALEKVRSEAFEDFGSLRRSSRLSIKTDSAKKRVKFLLRNNTTQELVDYETTVIKNPKNPHNASKQPIQGVLKKHLKKIA